MNIKCESDDDLPLSTILSIPVCAIIVRSVFKKKTTSIIHKFFYMNVFMNMKTKMKMIRMLQYK